MIVSDFWSYSVPLINLVPSKKKLERLANTLCDDSRAKSELCLGLSKTLADAGTPEDFAIAMENYIAFFSNGDLELENESRYFLLDSVLPSVIFTHPDERELYRQLLSLYHEVAENEAIVQESGRYKKYLVFD